MMDFKIGDADELADMAEKMIKGPGVDSEKLLNMQLGDLQSEAIAAKLQPFAKLVGMEEYQNTKEHKIFWKKASKQRLNDPIHGLRKAVSYTISNEIIEFLRPSVEKGNQRALYNACLNARPRHNNMWIEWESHDPLQHRGLNGWHIMTMPSVFKFHNGHAERSYPVKAGECFHFENYYEINSKHPARFAKVNELMDKAESMGVERDEAVRLATGKLQKRVGISKLSGSTDIWASEQIFQKDGSTYLPNQVMANDALNAMWFLGDQNGEFSPDMQTVMGDRWRIGLNNYIDDTPDNNKQVPFDRREEANKMAWLMAILSLMNFDWFVEEPHNAGVQGSKPMRGNITPFDSHHTVLLKLPKTRGRLIVPKQPKRGSSYGVRWHEVVGHKRHYRNEFGEIYKTIYIKPHERGDAKLGRITKDYAVVKDDEKTN